jgi:hypothetical protein
MATLATDAALADKPSRRTAERLFFWTMSLLIALIVFVGFARSYFLPGFRVVVHPGPPAPSGVVHVHAAVFTSWIVLLATQASLVGSGRVNIHRRLGVAGVLLAPAMIVLGVLVAVEMLNRFAQVPGFDSSVVFAVALSEVTAFAVPIFFAFRLRHRPEFHKRLILVATIAMMTAAFGRWLVHFLLHKPIPAMMATFSLLLVLALFDWQLTGKVHRATAFGAAWVACIEIAGIAVGLTSGWHSFAGQVHALTS